MKRLLAISFLVVFLLNILGYYGIFMGLRNQVAGKMRENLDESNYALSDEVTFKVPIVIPYATDMNEFERVDGEFNHEGNIYRLVKQKLLKDTLYIVCVKDSGAEKIDKALEDYVKTFSDKPSSEKGATKTLSNFGKDFISEVIFLEQNQSGWEITFPQQLSSSGKTVSFYSDIIQPPKI